MRMLFRAVAAVLALSAIPTFVAAQVYRSDTDQGAIDYAEVAGWVVRVDTTLGWGCFAFGEFERGTVFRIGLSPESESLYVMIGHVSWNSIEHGKSYRLNARFGNKAPWKIDATGYQLPGGFTVLMFDATDDRFVTEFQREHSISISYGGREISNLSLRGSYAAMEKTIECQQEVNYILADEIYEIYSDPFRNDFVDNDPFRVRH